MTQAIMIQPRPCSLVQNVMIQPKPCTSHTIMIEPKHMITDGRTDRGQ